MTASSVRLLAAMILLPALLFLAVAVAVAGCGGPPPLSPLQVLASGVPDPVGIAVDATTVYLSRNELGPILAVPVVGGLAAPVGGQGSGGAVAVDDQRLYWSDGVSILACDKSKCAGSMVTLAPVTSIVRDIALDSTNVYWATIGVGGSSGVGHVMKMDKHAGAPVELATTSWPERVAVDETNVYWIDQGPPTSGVYTVPIAGGPSTQLSDSALAEPIGLAFDRDNVYYATSDGTVFKVSKNGGPTRMLVTGVGQFVGGLASDGTNLYIDAEATLVRVPLTGGSAVAVAGGLRAPERIALDDTSVYIADDAGDAVVKVAK